MQEATNRAHRWVLGYVCHELRNPLHVVKACLSTLQQREQRRASLVEGSPGAPGSPRGSTIPRGHHAAFISGDSVRRESGAWSPPKFRPSRTPACLRVARGKPERWASGGSLNLNVL